MEEKVVHTTEKQIGDTIYINFIRNIKEAELERHFFEVLQELGLSATVESNQNGR